MRRVLFTGLFAVAAAMAPIAAVAFACTPQANIGLDRPTSAGNAPVYTVGESAVVLGYDFDPNSPVSVVIRLDGTEVASTPVDADGRIRATFAISTSIQPGPHTVSADGVDESGRPFRPAASFAVAAPVAVSAPAVDGASGPTSPAAVHATDRTANAAAVAAHKPAPALARRAAHSERPAARGRHAAAVGHAPRPAAPRSAREPRAFETPLAPAAGSQRSAGSAAGDVAATTRPRAGARRSRQVTAAPLSYDLSPGVGSLRDASPNTNPGTSFVAGAGLLGVGLVLLAGGFLVSEIDRRRRVPARADRNR